MNKIFLIFSLVGFVELILGVLGFAIPNTEYKPISDLANQFWAKPLIDNNGTLIIFGFILFIFFGILFLIVKTEKKP